MDAPDCWTCEQVNQFIIAYLEGEMDEETHAEFAKHLADCPNCAIFLEQYRSTVGVVGEVNDVEIPPALVDRTLDFLRHHYGRTGGESDE